VNPMKVLAGSQRFYQTQNDKSDDGSANKHRRSKPPNRVGAAMELSLAITAWETFVRALPAIAKSTGTAMCD
jgi:hypothetical protein